MKSKGKGNAMVNFMCNLDRVMGAQIFWVFLWMSFWMSLTFKSINWVKQMAHSTVDGTYPISGRPELGKGLTLPQITGNSSCLAAFELGHLCFSCLWTSTKTTAVPGSQACWPLGWNYTICFPRFLACSLQILGLVSFHNYMRQFFIINLFDKYPILSDYLENPNIGGNFQSKK